MKIYTTEDILGQWSNKDISITLLKENKLNFYKSTDSNTSFIGTFTLHKNHLILKYQINDVNVSLTFHIENLDSNLYLLDLSKDIGKIYKLKRTFYSVELIQKINFVYFDGVVDDLKEELNIEKFEFNTAKDKEGNSTNYYRHWDNTNRLAVIVKKELFPKLKKDKDFWITAHQSIKRGELGFYNNIFIKEYEEIENDYSPFDLRKVYDDYNYNNLNNDLRGFE